jgi:hypothetical protein
MVMLPFTTGMLTMRNQLKTKKRPGGSTSMVMYLDIQSISLYLRQQLALAPSCLLCKFTFKAVHGVFLSQNLFFNYCMLLSNLLTLYIYILCSTFFIFLLALVGVFYPYNRGALFTALVVIYALTAGIAGYTAASFFCQLEGTNWVSDHGFLFHCLLLTSFSGMPKALVIGVFL